MAVLSVKPYRVTVLFESGHDAWFESAAAALEYAESEMDRLLSEHEELATESFDGIFCERQGTNDTWRYESAKGVSMWVADREGPFNNYDSLEPLPSSAANRPID